MLIKPGQAKQTQMRWHKPVSGAELRGNWVRTIGTIPGMCQKTSFHLELLIKKLSFDQPKHKSSLGLLKTTYFNLFLRNQKAHILGQNNVMAPSWRLRIAKIREKLL